MCRDYFIHKTAIVETTTIGSGTYIGPFCNIGRNVEIGKDCNLYGHCSIGAPPQYKKNTPYSGGKIVIDNNVDIREFVTINLPTKELTYIGKNSVLMANVHIPHDAYLSEESFIVVGAAIAGFSRLGKGCYLGLNCSIHQHSILGDYCLIGSNSFFKGTSPAGLIWAGVPAVPIKANIVALENNVTDADLRSNIIREASQYIIEWRKNNKSWR